MVYIWLGLILILDIVATLLARSYAHGGNYIFLLISCVIYGLAMWPFGELMKSMPMSIANILWIVFSVIGLTLIDIGIFKEQFTYFQIIGFLCIVIGLILINFNK